MSGYPLSDKEITAVAESVRIADGEIDIAGWAATREVDHIVHRAGLDSTVGGVMYEATAGDEGMLTLSIDTYTGDIWSRATVGARVVEINGRPGLVDESSHGVSWSPADGVVATISGEIDVNQALRIAETVRPVRANDPRIRQAWDGRSE